MSYGILYFSKKETFANNDLLALSVDALLMASAIVISALAIAHIGNLSTLKYPLCIAGALVIATVAAIDVCAWVKLNEKKKTHDKLKIETSVSPKMPSQLSPKLSPKSELKAKIKDQIVHAQRKDASSIFHDMFQFCHHIFGNLWLGNMGAFLETTTFEGVSLKIDLNPRMPEVPIERTGNPEDFFTIITLNDIASSIKFGCRGLLNVDKTTIQERFSERRIQWIDLGILDHEDAQWEALIRKCGNIDNGRDLPTVDQWFEPVFQEIDKAVFENKKTLIHCHKGISRSACLLAAYIIKRFGVTADQAVTYLQSIRGCVNPHLIAALKNFESRLR